MFRETCATSQHPDLLCNVRTKYFQYYSITFWTHEAYVYTMQQILTKQNGEPGSSLSRSSRRWGARRRELTRGLVCRHLGALTDTRVPPPWSCAAGPRCRQSKLELRRAAGRASSCSAAAGLRRWQETAVAPGAGASRVVWAGRCGGAPRGVVRRPRSAWAPGWGSRGSRRRQGATGPRQPRRRRPWACGRRGSAWAGVGMSGLGLCLGTEDLTSTVTCERLYGQWVVYFLKKKLGWYKKNHTPARLLNLFLHPIFLPRGSLGGSIHYSLHSKL